MLLNICYFNTKKLLTAAVIASLLQGFAVATPVFAEAVADESSADWAVPDDLLSEPVLSEDFAEVSKGRVLFAVFCVLPDKSAVFIPSCPAGIMSPDGAFCSRSCTETVCAFVISDMSAPR